MDQLQTSDITVRESSEQTCLNCGTVYQGNFCPNCGQPAREGLKTSFGKFIKESVLDFFMWDSRLVKTLRIFFRFPGALTQEYNQGKRIGYLPPFRFFLFSTIVFFILNGFLNGSKDETEEGKSKFREFEQGLREGGKLDSLLSDTTNEQEVDDEWQIGLNGKISQSEAKKGESKQKSILNSKKEGKKLIDISSDSSENWFVKRIEKNYKALEERPNGVSELILRRFTHMLFFLMPLFALVLRVLFRKSVMAYTEHLVFSLHVHALLFLVFLFNILFSELGERLHLEWLETISNWMYIYPPVYLFLAMRRVYGQSRLKTFVKFFLLNSIYSFALVIGMGVAALLVLIGF
ncbi:MAG: DUF3667 domain-containing protein [Chloroherpetonaceae bacterium]|nr:DUF3667 domain-containing protein [Chloroherpetonaceae bacterium]